MAILVLLGPPGVGKGTQAARLKEALRLDHLSTGDILRRAVAAGTPLGQRVRSVMESGALVSDELVGEVVAEALRAGSRSGGGFLLDGFPRTLRQVEILDGILSELGVGLDHVVLIDAPEGVVLERLTGRRTCCRCGALYHATDQPPASAGVCDRCGEGLVQRKDDGEEIVAERLRVYRAQTTPLIAAFQGRGLIRRIDGTGPPDEVFARILAALRKEAA